jgi:hypothetical protein
MIVSLMLLASFPFPPAPVRGVPAALVCLAAAGTRGASGSTGLPDDHTAIFALALAAAGGTDPREHRRLLRDLQSPDYLGRLDAKEAYRDAARTPLRAQQVAEALARNAAASAQKTFLALIQSRVFLANDERVLALIRASASFRPASAGLVNFWDRHSRPGSEYLATTMVALVENGSRPALELFAKKLTSRSYPEDEKAAWMHSTVLAHRNDLALLETCERLLKGRLPPALRRTVIESLFDYRPEAWCLPAVCASPPPLRTAAQPSLAAVSRIGQALLAASRLDDVERTAIQRRLEEVRQLQGTGRDP